MDQAQTSRIPYPLEKADNPIFTIQFSAEDQEKIKTLRSIPENIQGVLQFLVDESGDSPTLKGIRIRPNPVLEAIATLFKRSPNPALKDYVIKYHNDDQKRDYLDAELEKICNYLAHQPLPNMAKSRHHGAIKTGQELRKSHESYDINGALDTKKLTAEQTHILQKIQKTIPANLQGFFICDLKPSETTPNKMEIERLVMNPITALKIIGAYTDHKQGHGNNTIDISGEDLRLIAYNLPNTGRKIA